MERIGLREDVVGGEPRRATRRPSDPVLVVVLRNSRGRRGTRVRAPEPFHEPVQPVERERGRTG